MCSLHVSAFIRSKGNVMLPFYMELSLFLLLHTDVYKRQVLDETEVEQYTIAQEIVEKNPELLSYIKDKLPGVESEMIPHTELKEMSKNVKFAIRTGEFTPYPNIILRAGVAFPA